MITKLAIAINLFLPIVLGFLSCVDSMIYGHRYIISASEWTAALILAAAGFAFAGARTYSVLRNFGPYPDSLSVGYVWQSVPIDLALMFVLLFSIYALQQENGRVLLWIMFVPCLTYYGMGTLMTAYFVSDKEPPHGN
jgi:hypothetical protein